MFITCTGLASNVCSSDDSRRTPGGKLYPDFSGMFLSDRMAFQFRWVIDGVIAFENDVAIALQFGTKLNTFKVAYQFHIGTLL